MTTQTEQQRSEALAKVLGIAASHDVYGGYDAKFRRPYLEQRWLCNDYEKLMKQAQKKRFAVIFNIAQVEVLNLKSETIGCKNYADHPSEEAATCAALYDALMAVGSK